MATQFAVDLVFKSQGLGKLDAATKELKGIDGAARKAQGGLNGASNSIKRTGRVAQTTSGQVKQLGQSFVAVKAAIAALGVGLIIRGFLGIASSAIQASGEIAKMEASFTSLTGSREAADDLRESLYRLGLETPFEDSELLNAGRRFLAVGVDVEKLGGSINRVGELAVQSGQSLDRLSLIYAQIYAKGRLQGEENLQLLEAGVNLNKELAEVTGKSGAELLDAMSKGQVSIEDVNKAIILATGSMQGLDEASKTAAIQLQNIGTSVKLVGTEFSKSIEPAFRAVFGVINEAFAKLFPNLDSLKAYFEPILEQAERFAEILEGNPELVDAITIVMDSLLKQALYPMVDAAEDFNDWLDQNPQGLINVVFDIELGIRQAVAGAQALVGLLDAAARLANSINPVTQAGNALSALNALGRGDTAAAWDSVNKLNPITQIPDISKDLQKAGERLSSIPQMQRLTVTEYASGGGNRRRDGSMDDGARGSSAAGGGGGRAGGGGRGGTASREAERLAREIERANQQYDELLRKFVEGTMPLREQLQDQQKLNDLIESGVASDVAQQQVDREREIFNIRANGVKAIEELAKLNKDGLLTTDQVKAAEEKIRKEVQTQVELQQMLNNAKDTTVSLVEKQRAAEEKAKANLAELTGLAQGISDTLEGGIVNGLTTAIDAMVSGADDLDKKLQEILKGVLQDIGNQLIKFGISQLFKSIGGGGAGGLFAGMFADGGTIPAGQYGIVGEAGPELAVANGSGGTDIIPMRGAMQRWNAGNAQAAEAIAGGGSEAGEGASMVNPVINISTGSVLNFEGNNYVSRDDFQAGLANAAKQGAQQGEQRALRKLQMSASTRRRLGM